MRFERVDENTVRCFISNEELEGYQIDYKDFVTRSDKAREVVRDIIEQATEEVGYRPPKFAFDMSIMMMPDQGLVLTFSENDPLDEKAGGGKLMEYLKEIKKAFEGATGDAAGVLPAAQGEKQEKKEKSEEPAAVPGPERGIFCFDSIGDVMRFAGLVPKNLRVHSALYQMEGQYYLLIQKGTASWQRYSRLCIQAMEFGALYGADEERYLFLQEHGECLVAEKALKKLAV